MSMKGEGNRQCIIKAADELFYRCGYNQTSFQDISDATGIPRGNFYYYFKTKDDILDAVVQARCNDFIEILAQFDASTTDPRERLLLLADMLRANEQNVLESGCPVGSLSAELAKDSADLQDKSRRVFGILRSWATEQFSALGLTQEADELAMDLLARMQGIIVMACAFKDAGFLQRSLTELKDWIRQVVGTMSQAG